MPTFVLPASSYLCWIIYGPGRSACAKANWKPRLRNWWMWRALAKYFPAELVKTVDLDPQHSYIFALHPHGILTCNSWMNFSSEATGFSRLFPGIEMHTGAPARLCPSRSALSAFQSTGCTPQMLDKTPTSLCMVYDCRYHILELYHTSCTRVLPDARHVRCEARYHGGAAVSARESSHGCNWRGVRSAVSCSRHHEPYTQQAVCGSLQCSCTL